MPRLSEYPKDFHDRLKYDLVRRVDLHYIDNKSDKVYILTVVEVLGHTPPSYQVLCYHGRRGHRSLTLQAYGVYPTVHQATSELQNRQREKENKGYKFIHEEIRRINGASLAPGKFSGQQTVKQAKIPFPSKPTLIDDVHSDFVKITNMKTLPGMSAMTTDLFAKKILRHDVVMFQLTNLKMMYAILHNEDWLVIDALSPYNDVIVSVIPLDPAGLDTNAVKHLQGLGWLGTFDKNGVFEILDIIRAPGVNQTYNKSWTARRQMMNTAHEMLYPGVDPYDSSNKLRFIDYIHERKGQAFAAGRGQIFAAFDLQRPLVRQFYVSNN